MLGRLLSLLKAGSVHTSRELAAQLGVTESLLGQMLADLSRMGYLRPTSGLTCQTLPTYRSSSRKGEPDGRSERSVPCAECPLASTCAVGEPGGQIWTLTDKALQRAGD